jgi:TolA-binding protein
MLERMDPNTPAPPTDRANTATARSASASSGVLGYLPWIGGGIVAGLITVAAMGIFESSPATPEAAAPSVEVPTKTAGAASSEPAAPAPSETAPAPREEPSAAPSAEGVWGANAPHREEVVLPKAAMASLAEEMAALDAARQALTAGDAPRALRAMDDYDRRFPGGMLGPDAAVLRIEALMHGDRAEAARLGAAFLAAHPTSPHAAHVRALLAPPAPHAP